MKYPQNTSELRLLRITCERYCAGVVFERLTQGEHAGNPRPWKVIAAAPIVAWIRKIPIHEIRVELKRREPERTNGYKYERLCY